MEIRTRMQSALFEHELPKFYQSRTLMYLLRNASSLKTRSNHEIPVRMETHEYFNLRTYNAVKIIIYEKIKASIKYPLFVLSFIFLLFGIFREKKAKKEIIFFTLSIFLIMIIYLIPEGFKYIKQTLDRVIFQTTGFYLVYLVLFINKLKFKI